jgi:ankyrin repeat protein
MKIQRLQSVLPAVLAISFVLTVSLSLHGAAAGTAGAADAAEKRDMQALRELVQQRANVNTAQTDGTTALHWAAHWNDKDAVNMLLRAGADPKATNRYGATPLSEAAAAGNAGVIEALLAAGADARTLTTPDGETVLMTAARTGSLNAVQLLLDHGADVNAVEQYKGQTALMWAAAESHTDIVKLLLERGADWKVISFDRPTKIPKLSAASSISPIARGGFAAIHFTAREGDIETMKVMLAAGVDINQTDVDQTSALVVSIMNKRFAFAKFLLDRGANANLADVNGRTPIYAAVDIRNEDWSTLPSRREDASMSSIDILKAILERGANPDAPLTKSLSGRSGMDSGDTSLGAGATPLMRAARSGDAAAMRLLLEKGANSKLTTKDGNNAFLFAAGIGYRDKYTKGTEEDAIEALKIMLERGADVNQTNPKGETALHGAASRGADAIVQFLVDRGANLNIKRSSQGLTPLDVAMGKGSFAGLPVPYPTTVELIRKLGGREGQDSN